MIGTKSRALDLGCPVERSHPLNRGLVGLWLPIPQGPYYGGSRLVNLAGRVHGTLTNSPTWATGRNGTFGGLSFNGGNQYVDLNDFTAVTTDTVSFSSLYVLRKTDSSTGTKIVNTASATGGKQGYLGWTDSAGRGWECGVPALGGSSPSGAPIEVSGTPHTTFDNDLHVVSWDYPGGNAQTTPSLVQWVIDGQQHDGAAGTAGGATSDYWLGGRGSTAGWPGVIYAHLVWVPSIGPAALKQWRHEILSGFPTTLRWLSTKTYSFASDGGGGGFQAAWARHSNVLIGGTVG